MVNKLLNYLMIPFMGLMSVLPVSTKAKETKGLEKIVSINDLNGPTSFDVIGNTFSQPNIHMQVGRNKLDWYGSGDVNNDEQIDSLDLVEINNQIQNDRSDIDGDGVPSTQDDKLILQNYLNGNINYLPSHWNELTNRLERKSWMQKMLAIDNADEIDPWADSTFGAVCADYTRQHQINFYGISNIDEFIQEGINQGGITFSGENNARFNLPVYHVGTRNEGGILHSVGGIKIDEDPKNFNDWYFFDVYSNEEVQPGDFAMDENFPVDIGLTAYLEDPDFPGNYDHAALQNIINFDLNNGNASFVSAKPYVIFENPNLIEVDVESVSDTTLNYQTNLDTSPNVTGIPNVTVSNSSLEATLTHEDGIAVPTDSTYPEYAYYFDRTWTGSVYSGGVTKTDTEVQRINVNDTERPHVGNLEDITITKDDSLHPSVTGYPNITDNTLVQDTVINYELISENTFEKKYNAFANVTDVFGNDTTYNYQTVTVDLTTAIGDDFGIKPLEFNLYQNYPNPFNNETTIKYDILDAGRVSLKIYDLLGNELITLVNTLQGNGQYKINFDASKMVSGVYFYQIQINDFMLSRKLVLLK